MRFENRTNTWSEQIRLMYPDRPGSTRNISFVLTEDCNLRCTYCYMTGANTGKRMSIDVADQAIEYILKLDSPGVVLDFIGGEPLLEIDLLDYIISRFKTRSFELGHTWFNSYMINLTTNGILYENHKFQDFLKKNQGLVHVTITIDGDKTLHDSCRLFPNGNGSYDIVSKNIKLWVSQFPHASTKVTFSPNNIKHISTSIPHLYELGIKSIHANPVYEDVWLDKHAKIYYNQLIELANTINQCHDLYFSPFDINIGGAVHPSETNNWCGGTGAMLAIGTDGRLFPCIRYMKYSLNNYPEQCIGDVWRGIDENNPFLFGLRTITRQSQSTGECLNCPVSSGCGWCSANNYDLYGTANKRSTSICKLHKARVLANKYYWDKRGIDVQCNLTKDDIAFLEGQ